MPKPEGMTVLLVNEQADEIKLMTVSLRSFYPGCRVEAVYSANEALEWASKLDWHMILLDEQLSQAGDLDLLQEIRRRAPQSAIIVEGVQQDPRVALRVMRAGADYYFFKYSSAAIMDLPLVTREAVEKRDLRSRLDLSQDRYQNLIENLTETVYELDAEGRFVYVSPTVKALLNYEPHELIGLPYSSILGSDELAKAERHFNERRALPRATRKLQLQLKIKGEAQKPIVVELNATALYDRHRQYLGTTGILRPVVESGDKERLARRLADLAPPLTTILANAEQLLHTLQDVQKEFAYGSSASAVPHPPSMSTKVEDSPIHLVPSKTTDECLFPERRRSLRTEVQMETYLRLDGTAWTGTTLNVSLGGVYTVFKGPVSAYVFQSIRLGFISDVGILEISGRVCEIREPAVTHDYHDKLSLTGLAVEFSVLQDSESRILKSLFEGLRSRTVTVKLTAVLLPHDAGQHQSGMMTDHERVELVDIPAGFAKKNEGGPGDRRVSARVHLDVPVQVESIGTTPRFDRREGHLVDLTTTGARVRLHASPDGVGHRIRLCLDTSLTLSDHSTQYASGKEDCVIGDVVWVSSTSAVSTTPSEPSSTTPLLIGLRFIRFDGASERRIAQLITRYLTSPDRIQDPHERTTLVSELLECLNERGHRLVLYHDHPREALPPGSPLVILAPGFGETKRDYVSLAYHFAGNGFRVIRYDHTFHIGDSQGDIVHTTLTTMNEDLRAILSYADRLWPASPILVVASGVTGRVALKTILQSRAVKFLLLLGGVVDVQSTLRTVHGEDLVGGHLHGMRRGVSNLLGFSVDADRWLADATRQEYSDLATTLKDAEQVKTPVVFFSSEHDSWVDQDALKKVKTSLREYAIDWYLMADAVHDIHKRPERARDVFQRMVGCCRAWSYPLSDAFQLSLPLDHELDRQVRLERERARTQHHMAKSEAFEFWRDYLDQSQFIVNFSDYWHLLNHIYRLMGNLGENDCILDAGCGNGNFGMFLLINESYRLRNSPVTHRMRYLGVDFVMSGLSQAQLNLSRVAADIHERFPSTERPLPILTSTLAHADLDQTLPFHDNQFNRILCNLVIGYLRDPLFTLRELMRALSPGGRLVITIFKPQADLSPIYRNFLGLGKPPEEIEKAKQVLNTSGKIAQREQEGVFRFLDRQELATLLISSGALQPRIYSTFANQAYIAVAEKADKR